MKSFQQLTGSTTASQYPGSFCDLSQNNSSANVARGGVLINDRQRYYLQKYFDNERTYTTVTVGAATLTLTGVVSIGQRTGTLSVTWTSITCQQLVVFSNGEQRMVSFFQNQNGISWQTGLTSAATATLSTVGVQFYPIPANVSKIKNSTISVGQLVYTPAPIQSIQEWTMLNALPYTSNIPNYFYIYQNQVGFFPIPSSSGQIISFNFKSRVADMSFNDFNTGTISSAVIGSNTIVGSGTTWNSVGLYPLNADLTFANLMLSITPPKGDGLFYQIHQFQTDSVLDLNFPIVNAPSVSSASYTIGQFPIIHEDFHDLLIYSSLMIYYSSIVDKKDKFELYKMLTDEREKLMSEYLSDKSVNVDLGGRVMQQNPNLYIYSS